jgi:hypothetical protein
VKRSEAREYAWEDFGDARLGDARRTGRVVSMATAAYERPAGRILEVFQTSADRQGAYDFLANPSCSAEALISALGQSTARRCEGLSRTYASVDGSSISVVDRTGKKGFGRIGSTKSGGRGLKVVTSYAIDQDGVPVGVLDQQWWARASGRKRHNCHSRKLEDKETKHWINALQDSRERVAEHAPQTQLCFLLDRENDRRHCLTWLRDSGAMYIVRSCFDRCLDAIDKRYLIEELGEVAPTHEYRLQVIGGPKRTARLAKMAVRTVRVRLRLRDRWLKKAETLVTTVVETREEGTCPAGESPIAWRLLTNQPVLTGADADEVIAAYALRWRIEEFHRTWKSGGCNVEDSQLRDGLAMIKWAIIMAAAAARIERIKILSREQPELPASDIFSPYEVRAIILMKRKYKKRTETIPDAMPTLAQATYWLAELGGYTGKSSGGPPGSTNIRRGLDFVRPAAIAIETLENEGKLR